MSSPEFFRSVDFYPVIDADLCTRCMKCMNACTLQVVSPIAPARLHACRNCRACVEQCAAGAIHIVAHMGGTRAGHLKRDLEQGGCAGVPAPSNPQPMRHTECRQER